MEELNSESVVVEGGTGRVEWGGHLVKLTSAQLTVNSRCRTLKTRGCDQSRLNAPAQKRTQDSSEPHRQHTDYNTEVWSPFAVDLFGNFLHPHLTKLIN